MNCIMDRFTLCLLVVVKEFFGFSTVNEIENLHLGLYLRAITLLACDAVNVESHPIGLSRNDDLVLAVPYIYIPVRTAFPALGRHESLTTVKAPYFLLAVGACLIRACQLVAALLADFHTPPIGVRDSNCSPTPMPRNTLYQLTFSQTVGKW
jgi:hypothetical protein